MGWLTAQEKQHILAVDGVPPARRAGSVPLCPRFLGPGAAQSDGWREKGVNEVSRSYTSTSSTAFSRFTMRYVSGVAATS